MSHGALQHIEFRVIVCGESGVGKTCLVSRCKYNFTIPDAECVQGQRGWSEESRVSITVDKYRVKIILADTAGQERFGSLPSQFYRRCHGVLLVYDINSRSSFDALKTWVNDIRNYSTPSVKFLIGNKLELARATSREEAEKFARANNFDFYMEVSAKTGANREDFLRKMGEELLEKSKEKDHVNNADGDVIRLRKDERNKRKWYCLFLV